MESMSKSLSLSYPSSTHISYILVLIILATATQSHAAPGRWQLLQRSVGVSAMQMQLLNNDRVILYDRTNFGPSNISLPNGKCRVQPPDCTAHSVEYDVPTNTFRPLMLITDTLCSSGTVTPDSVLVSTGGFMEGEPNVRLFQPCSTKSCDWKELGNKLFRPRWYSTNHILPNGRVIIVGGRNQSNYEFYPKKSNADLQELAFLKETNDGLMAENNLYPFVFLNTDGNLFIFANNRAILLNYMSNKVVRTYPTIPGGEPRCFPSSGSAVLLPLKNIDNKVVEAEFLVCGGAPKGSYHKAKNGQFLPALKTCARLKITDSNPKWVMETMPMPRVMGDMVLLPDGQVLIVNGVSHGTADFGSGRNAVLNPFIYNPDGKPGSRFEVQAPSTRPRVYHSTAILLRDGRVLIGGSNTQGGYDFKLGLFPTDLSLEAFSPSYLDSRVSKLRPKIISQLTGLKYKQVATIRFTVAAGGVVDDNKVKVVVIMPPFNTHSFSQGQRMLVLNKVGKVDAVSKSTHQVVVRMPKSADLAPPGYYLLFVVYQGVPSEGKWIKI